MRKVLAVFVLSVLSACNKPAPPAEPPAPPPIDEAAAKQGVDALWARLITADTAGNTDAYIASFTETARVDAQGMPAIVGRAALDSVLRPMFAMHDATGFQVSPTSTTVLSNDLVYQSGTYRESYLEKKKASTEYGRYAASFARGTDGQWRIAYWMGIHDSIVGRK